MNDSNSNRSAGNLSERCIPDLSYTPLFFAPVPALQIVINAIVIAAVIDSRQKLRHNFVYAYVINTSMANLMFGLFSLYELLNLSLAFERNWNAPEPFRSYGRQWLGWWAFRTGMIVSLFITMSGSISALIYGIRESSYFIGRTAHYKVKGVSKSRRRVKMWSIIFFIWFVPISLCVASAAGWSCVRYCECTPTFYSNILLCHADISVFCIMVDENKGCSTVMHPQRNSFMLLAAIIWLFQTIVMITMIITTIREYMLVVRSNRQGHLSTVSSINLSEQVTPTTSSGTEANNSTTNGVLRNDPISDDDASVNSAEGARVDPPPHFENDLNGTCISTRCIKIPVLNHNIKLLLTISVLFVLCTLPSMLITFIDIISKEFILNFLGITLPFLFCLMYGLIAPLVLVHYMAGLKLAVIRILYKCSCCKRTVVTGTGNTSNRSR